MKIYQYIFLVVWAVVGASAQAADVPVPELTSRVTDLTATLTEVQKNELKQKIIQFEQQQANGAQIAVLMVSTTGNMSIEQFAVNVFNSWKLGDKNRNNGVLLLIAKDDRRLRIEVGYGLEAVLTDAQSGRIIRDVMTPELKKEQYFAAIDSGVNSIKSVINGEVIDPVVTGPIAFEQVFNTVSHFFLVLLICPLAFLFSYLILRRRRTPGAGTPENKKNLKQYKSIKGNVVVHQRVYQRGRGFGEGSGISFPYAFNLVLLAEILTCVFGLLLLRVGLGDSWSVSLSTVIFVLFFNMPFAVIFLIFIAFMNFLRKFSTLVQQQGDGTISNEPFSTSSFSSSSSDSGFSSSSSDSFSGGGGSSGGGGASGNW